MDLSPEKGQERNHNSSVYVGLILTYMNIEHYCKIKKIRDCLIFAVYWSSIISRQKKLAYILNASTGVNILMR